MQERTIEEFKALGHEVHLTYGMGELERLIEKLGGDASSD